MADAIQSVPPVEILESLADAVFTVDADWRITSFNQAAEKMTGFGRQEVLGNLCHEIFRSTLCRCNCPLRSALVQNASTLATMVYITDNMGQPVLVNASAALLRNSTNKVIGGVESFQDLRLLCQGSGSMELAVQACEAQTLIAALERNNNNRAAAARDLGIHKSTFFRKIKNLGIDLPDVDGRFRHTA